MWSAAAGIVLQLDCPDLAMGRHIQFGQASLEEFRRQAALNVEALNYAVGDIPPEHAAAAIGLFLISWGIFTAYMFVASLRTTGAVALVLFLLTITFLLLGIGNAGEHEGMVEIGGWAGLLTAAAAWYASFAAVINSTFGRTVLPVMPLGGRD